MSGPGLQLDFQTEAEYRSLFELFKPLVAASPEAQPKGNFLNAFGYPRKGGCRGDAVLLCFDAASLAGLRMD